MRKFAPGLACALCALALALLARPARAADAVVDDCSSDAPLRAALTAVQGSGGGTLTFDCGPAPEPIVLLGGALPEITTPTTVDGGGAITISGGNAVRIFSVAPSGSLTLRGLTLVRGLAGDGGAVRSKGSLTIEDSAFRDNRAGFYGGALFVDSDATGQTTIAESSFEANRAGQGGALYLGAGSAISITGSHFQSNWAEGNTFVGSYGGAVYLREGATATVERSLFLTNRSTEYGAAISNTGTLTLRFVTLQSNLATTDGSALYNDGALILSRSLVQGNGTSAIINERTGVLTLVNATLAQNREVTLKNLGQVDITYSTIDGSLEANREASTGILSLSGRTSLRNTIVYDFEFACLRAGGSVIASLGYNISDQTGACRLTSQGDLQISSALLLSPLGNWGGPTASLLPTFFSPAIDNGRCIDGIAIDQRDLPRPQGAGCDIGAVEARRFLLTVTRAGAGRVTSDFAEIDCGATCSASLGEWTEVTLTATADEGSTFEGWGGACRGAGVCVVTLSEARAVTATFSGAERKVYLPAVQR